MENAIIIVVLAAIIGGAVAYIIKAKRNGVKCIGCSAGGSCGQNNGGSCGRCNGGAGCGCGCESSEDRGAESCGCHKETK